VEAERFLGCGFGAALVADLFFAAEVFAEVVPGADLESIGRASDDKTACVSAVPSRSTECSVG
jgi:hypothetical protein